MQLAAAAASKRALRPAGAVAFRQSRSSSYATASMSSSMSTSASSMALADGGDHVDVPVVIVGAGPVGLTLSILLSKYGVRSLLVEKSIRPSSHPQAHFIHYRSMEVFRSLDGLADEIRQLSPPLDEWRRFVYCTAMTGQVFGSVDHWRDGAPDKPPNDVSPVKPTHFSQNKLVPLLMERARQLYNAFTTPQSSVDDEAPPLSGILLGHQCIYHSQSPSAVAVDLEPLGLQVQGKRQRVSCRHLIATDGANSSIRAALGVGMSGQAALQHFLSVHFTSGDLGLRIRERPGMLYFVFNQKVICVVVAHNITEGEFVAQLPYYPPHQTAQEFSNGKCMQLIKAAAGVPDLDMEIKILRPWVMSAEVADKLSLGRVFLAGDSAHRFPPAGAFGMHTGIQDVHNLAWKLAAVHSGKATEDLMRTYEQERRPIAEGTSRLSVRNFRDGLTVPNALGLNLNAVSTLTNVMSGSPAAYLPQSTRSWLLDSAMSAGRTGLLQPTLLTASSLFGGGAAAVQAALERGRTLRMLFPREDLGFRYTAGALYDGDSADQQSNPSSTNPFEYVPTTRPGCRLPHLELVASQGQALSTLDLHLTTRMEHLLIVSAGASCLPWIHAVRSLAELGMPLRSIAIASDAGSASQLSPADAVEVYRDVSGRWPQLREVSDGGVILVRPDGVVAWRAHNSCPQPEARETLLTILREHLFCEVADELNH